MTIPIPFKLIRWVILLIILFMFSSFLYWIRGILVPFILAFLLAYLLNPAVEFWQKKGLSRPASILLTYVLSIGGLSLIGFYVFPIILRQLDVLMVSIPNYTGQVQKLLQEFYADYQRVNIPESIRAEIDSAILRVETTVTNTIGQIINGILGLFSHTFSIAISPILAFYILSDQAQISKKFINLIPLNWRSEILMLWTETDEILIKFIRGHLLVALVVGMLTALGLFIIGLDFPFLLGLIAGVADIIPYFGPIIGAVPALALAVLQSKKMVIYVIIVMLIVQQLESNIISPKILGSSVGLHPLTVIFVLLVGGKIYGVIGMLLAVPLTAVSRILIRYLFNRLLTN